MSQNSNKTLFIIYWKLNILAFLGIYTKTYYIYMEYINNAIDII